MGWELQYLIHQGTWKNIENNPVLHKPKDSLIGVGHGAYFTDEKRRLQICFSYTILLKKSIHG